MGAMPVDDCNCIVPLPTSPSEGTPLLRAAARCGSLPSLSEFDLNAAAAADLGAASSWCGDAGRGSCTVEARDASTRKPEQCQTSEVASSRAASRGRYARSKAGWFSKGRSTPEGYNREEHAFRFESPYLPGTSPSSMVRACRANFQAPVVVCPPKKKKSPEERKAARDRKNMQNERASVHHVQTALRKYNRANNTMFELDEITVKCQFFEFGGPCYHYNFTAKSDNHPSAGGSINRFFAEINIPLKSEDDVLLCCIIGENDAGHCHACEDYRPTMVHPSSRAYGGGNTTAIDYPDDTTSSSDSEYYPRGRHARSKAGWASKERRQFEPPFPHGMSESDIIDAYLDAFEAPGVVHPPKKKKSPEERKAIRQQKIMQSERDSVRDVETALRKYNRANNTTFVLDEITVKCLFFEFGAPCYHYNFTAKPENNHSADGSAELFFSEINYPLQSENDVLLCCIVGEKDAGHCHACKGYRPMMVHPSSRAYGGGNTSAIDYPDEDSSSSDDDY